MIKVLFVLFVVYFNLRNKIEMQKSLMKLQQYLSTFKDMKIVKLLEKMELQQYI